MKVVILGGGGFIGSNLVKHFAERGDEVIAVDVVFPEWRADALKDAAARWTLDLRDPAQASIAMFNADVVYHLAADMGGVAWFHGPQDWPASLTNGLITNNVLTAATKADVGRLVYTSSACAYATEIQQTVGAAPKLAEGKHLSWGTPDAGYGWEKRYGLELCTRAPIDARVAICHTIFGPYQEHEGQRMKFPAAVLTKALAARRTGRLELWGSGEQLRSYLYVDDAVSKLARLGVDDAYSGPVNVGAEGAVSCGEVARMCLDIVGADGAEVVTVPGPVGVWSRDCDNRKWNDTYGETKATSLPDAFAKFAEWVEPHVETATRTAGVERAVRPPTVR